MLEDEANIESHQYYYGDASLSHVEEFRDAHVERVMEMAHATINNPSVVIWSLGNEAGPGKNFVEAYNALKAHGVEHLYELALIDKERLFKTRNFGRKCMLDVITFMDAYGLEFDNIESLKNPKVSFLKGPYVDVPLYVLEQRNRELCHR
jgi:DNA-directed RNA polymerase alpha subunit